MRTTLLTLSIASLSSFAAWSQAPNAEALFTQHCAACHVNPTEEDVPTRAAMAALAPNAIVETLTEGTMRLQGQALTQPERVAIAAAENTAAPNATSTPRELPPSVRCGPIVMITPTKPIASADQR